MTKSKAYKAAALFSNLEADADPMQLTDGDWIVLVSYDKPDDTPGADRIRHYSDAPRIHHRIAAMVPELTP